MKSIILFCVSILFASHSLLALQPTDSVAFSFYVHFLEELTRDTIQVNDNIKFGYILVKTDIENLDTTVTIDTVKFRLLSEKGASNEPYSISPFKKNKGRLIINIFRKDIAIDTVDIISTYSSITQAFTKRKWLIGKRHMYLGIATQGCKGTCGFIADRRFVFLQEENKWAYYRFINDCKTITMKRIE